MNSPATLRPAADPQLAASRADLAHARAALQRTLTFVRELAQPWPASGLSRASDDPYLISRFGDLSIRIDVAQALLERAEASPATPLAASLAALEASIASADALQAVGNLEEELTGSRDTPPKAAHIPPLRWKYQLLGNQRLNGVAPPVSEELFDAP